MEPRGTEPVAAGPAASKGGPAPSTGGLGGWPGYAGGPVPAAPPPPPGDVPLPPPPPVGRRTPLAPTGAPPAVGEAVLAIPLGIRPLLRQSLDLLTRRDAGLRGASFYIGFVMLVTVGPLAAILGLLMTEPMVADPVPFDPSAPAFAASTGDALAGWMLLAMLPGFLGYLAAATEARSMAAAVIGGRVEGRPLRLRESISLARQRFWHVLGAQVLVGLVTGIVGGIVSALTWVTLGPVSELSFGISLVASVVLTLPFVYVPASIVLGQVGILDAIGRSWRLVRMRRRLAVVVALFTVLGQFIVLFGLSAGLDLIARLMVGTGLVESFPRPLVVPIAAVVVFAMGTLTFLVESIAAAPAVHAFVGLTHYTGGLQDGRDRPVRGTGIGSPWVTPGLALAAALALLALLGAIGSIAG